MVEEEGAGGLEKGGKRRQREGEGGSSPVIHIRNHLHLSLCILDFLRRRQLRFAATEEEGHFGLGGGVCGRVCMGRVVGRVRMVGIGGGRKGGFGR